MIRVAQSYTGTLLEATVVGFVIRKYAHATINKRFDDDVRISYAETETVVSVDNIECGPVREAWRKVGINNGIGITTIADISSRGVGLGSSSAIAVGLLNAIYAFKGYLASRRTSRNRLRYAMSSRSNARSRGRIVHLLTEHMLSFILRDSPDCAGSKGR